MTISIDPLALPAPEFGDLTYPRYRPYVSGDAPGGPRMEAVGARLDGRPVGLALLLHIDPTDERSDPVTRVLSIFVGADHRRQGLGRAILEQALSLARQAGSVRMRVEYSSRTRNRKGFEGFLAANGWDEPSLLEFRLGALAECTKTLDVAWAPMIERAKRKGYASTPWFDMTPQDRTVAEALTRTDPFAGRYPFWLYEKHADPLLSLALRLHGEVVGWVLAETPPDKRHHHYVAGFVRRDLQVAGWLAIGIFDASQRQYDHYGPKSVTLYETRGDNPRMISFMKRRQAFVTEWMDERYACHVET